MTVSRSVVALALMAGLTLPVAVHAQDAAAGEAVFKRQCGICHSPVAGKNMVGPSLFGVIGRTAGTVPGFHYSQANKTSGITWDAARLDPYLTNPREVVPGTTMAFAGLKDAQQRGNLIAYLATLK
jgi:cytochrome c